MDKNNISNAEEPILNDDYEYDSTCFTFVPDLQKFKMDKLDDDTIALLAKRAYDIAACTPDVEVFLNDKPLPNKFEDYCKLYLRSELDESGDPVKLIYEKLTDRWEVAVAFSQMGFQQVSFVNSIATINGGRHVDHVLDQMVKSLSKFIINKSGDQIEINIQIKNRMWIFVNCLIENPTFDSLKKEHMTLQLKSISSKACNLNDDFIKKISKCGIIDKESYIVNSSRAAATKAKDKIKKHYDKSAASIPKQITKSTSNKDFKTKSNKDTVLQNNEEIKIKPKKNRLLMK